MPSVDAETAESAREIMTVQEAGPAAISASPAESTSVTAGQAASVVWYVGRAGHQYGPVGNSEFWAMLASGQVLPTDLVWRDGFPEWRLASLLQPPTKDVAPDPITPAEPETVSTPAPPQSAPSESAGATYRASSYSDAQTIAPSPSGARPQNEHPRSASVANERALSSSLEEPAQGRKRKQRPDASERPSRSVLGTIGRGLAWTGVVLFFAATLGAAYLMVTGDKSLMRSLSAMVPQFGERVETSAPLVGFAPTTAATDEALQKTTLGRALKKYHANWYAERVKESSDAIRGGKPDADVAASFMQAVVKLRREYAGDATSASVLRMKSIATRFAANLVRLRSHSVDACFQYVSSGESAPAIVALLQGAEHTSALQAQLVATLEGIDEGRKTPRVYPQPKASDYDVLVAALEARGWKKDELTLFADSQRLAKAPPETVCRLVTEWFEAQLTIKDADVQLRLLADSLRPIVAG